MARGKQNKKIAEIEQVATLEAVKNLDTAKVVSDVNNLQVSLQSTLADVSASITSKLQQMATIDQAIALKQARLKDLFEIEAAAMTVDDMRAKHQEEADAFEAAQKETRALWQKEIVDQQQARKRDNEEYDYHTKKTRERSTAEFNSLVATREQNEAARIAALQKDWAAREEALKAKEAEFTNMQRQVAELDARVKTEVGKAEAIIKAGLTKLHEHEKALMAKDVETQKTVAELNVNSLNKTIADQQKQLDELRAQLSAARADAKEIATQALSSSSDRKVADALRQMVDSRDQAGTTKGK